MTPVPDIRITLELGGRRRTLSASELVAPPGLAATRAVLLANLVAAISPQDGGPHVVHTLTGEPTERGNGSENENINSFPEPLVPSMKEEVSQTEILQRLDTRVHAVATLLACALVDQKSLRFYRLVAQGVPLRVIRSALSQALELTPREVKRSRAAYFTAIIRPVLSRRSSN